jgi:hypothetical protein
MEWFSVILILTDPRLTPAWQSAPSRCLRDRLQFCAPGASETTTAKAQRANLELFETQESITDFFMQRACPASGECNILLAAEAFYIQGNPDSSRYSQYKCLFLNTAGRRKTMHSAFIGNTPTFDPEPDLTGDWQHWPCCF